MGDLKYLDSLIEQWLITLSIIVNFLFTGTKTDFNQYLSNENVQGFISNPNSQSSFTRQICLEYYVLNHNTCFSVNLSI